MHTAGPLDRHTRPAQAVPQMFAGRYPDQTVTRLVTARPPFSRVELHGDNPCPFQRTKIARSRGAAALGIDDSRLLA
jgi:hypothetical protein